MKRFHTIHEVKKYYVPGHYRDTVIATLTPEEHGEYAARRSIKTTTGHNLEPSLCDKINLIEELDIELETRGLK